MTRRNASAQVDSVNEAASARPVRRPVGTMAKLVVHGKDPNFEYRFVNDEPGRIAMFKQAGWQLCKNDEVDTGTFRAEEASELGSLAYSIVDGGTGMKAYVMRIHKDEYEEIQQILEREATASEETLRPNIADGEYGHVKIDRSGRS